MLARRTNKVIRYNSDQARHPEKEYYKMIALSVMKGFGHSKGSLVDNVITPLFTCMVAD